MSREDELLQFARKNMSKPLKYNIFDVLDVAHREVIICRFMADLLDPRGAHGKGDKFLRLFMEKILSKDGYSIDWTEEDYKNTQVYTEYPLGNKGQNKRRIDIVIKSNKRFIPIEAKIYAGDQKSQCYDYWCYASKRNLQSDTFVWYLTREGTLPSDYSRRSSGGDILLSRKNIKTLSFKKDILKWAEGISELCGDGDDFKTVIYQFTEAIMNFTGGANMSISKMLYNDLDMFRAGKEIEKSFNEVRTMLINDLFNELELELKSRLRLERTNVGFMEYENCSYNSNNSLSDKRGETWPGINYCIETKTKFNIPSCDNAKLFMRVEIYKTLWAGVVALETVKTNGPDEYKEYKPLEDSKAKQLWAEADKHFNLNTSQKTYNNWNIMLLDDDKDNPYGDPSGQKGSSIPDFWNMNDSAINLIDKGKRKEFISKVIDNIQRYIYDGNKYIILKN